MFLNNNTHFQAEVEGIFVIEIIELIYHNDTSSCSLNSGVASPKKVGGPNNFSDAGW